MKAAGAVYRNAMAWSLQERLGIRMEQYGKDGEFTRIAGMPGDLIGHCRSAGQRLSKRPGRWALRSRATRPVRQRRTRSPGPASRPTMIRRFGMRDGVAKRRVCRTRSADRLASWEGGRDYPRAGPRSDRGVGRSAGTPHERGRPCSVFPTSSNGVGNATAGLLNHEAVATSIERVLLNPEVVRLTRPPRSAEGRADMAHTRLYSTRHTLQMEQEVRDMAAGMAVGTGHSLSAQAIENKVTALLEAGYPLSEEQITAIRTVTSSGGRVAIIEGAAGLGQDHDAPANCRSLP